MKIEVLRDGKYIILVFGSDASWSGMRLKISLEHAVSLMNALKEALRND